MDYSNFEFSKPKIKKHKRETVKPEVYNEVYERDKGRCKLCGAKNIALHHIIYRSEDKFKINDINNCIMLCTKHHMEVHSNKHYWQPILKNKIKEK